MPNLADCLLLWLVASLIAGVIVIPAMMRSSQLSRVDEEKLCDAIMRAAKRQEAGACYPQPRRLEQENDAAQIP